MKLKCSVSWSGGKDSALALYKVLSDGEVDVVSLHTVFDAETKRVGMHGIHEDLIEAQAEAIGIPLTKLYLKSSNDHHAYTSLIKEFFDKCRDEGLTEIVFGDIFLEDLKSFRDNLLSASQLKGSYPLWKKDCHGLLQDFLRLGFKTVICSANKKFFESNQLGKVLDHYFFNSLPQHVDPCGENGEFHTFVIDGPIFTKSISISLGPVVEKQYAFRVSDTDGKAVEHQETFLFQDAMLF